MKTEKAIFQISSVPFLFHFLAIKIFEKYKPEEDDFVYIPWRKRPKPVDYQEKRISRDVTFDATSVIESELIGREPSNASSMLPF